MAMGSIGLRHGLRRSPGSSSRWRDHRHLGQWLRWFVPKPLASTGCLQTMHTNDDSMCDLCDMEEKCAPAARRAARPRADPGPSRVGAVPEMLAHGECDAVSRMTMSDNRPQRRRRRTNMERGRAASSARSTREPSTFMHAERHVRSWNGERSRLHKSRTRRSYQAETVIGNPQDAPNRRVREAYHSLGR